MTTIKRIYHVADSTMLDSADVFHALYVVDEADYSGFSSAIFTANFKTDFLAEINAARAVVQDMINIDEMAEETALVTAKTKECADYFISAKFFIEKAFPDNQAVWNQFGYNDYRKASRSQSKMIGFMEMFFIVATKYTAQLNAQGFTAAKIAQIQTLETQLRTEQLDQETFKKNRPLWTQDRIIILNKPYQRMVDIHNASKTIYKNNFAKLHQYALPHSGTTPPPAPAVISMVTDQTTLQAIILKIAGNALATDTEQFKIAFGDGNEGIGTLANGILAIYPHDYNIPGADASGIYTITITPVTAGALSLMGVLQFDNCKFKDDVTIPAAVQASGIQMPNNHITNFNMQPASYSKLTSLVLFNNDMTASNVNFNLIGLDDSGLPNGFANFGGGTNAAPTGAGITAKNNLIAKGWTVITN
ncbi:MAG: hypothetical protein HY840_07175 [Bacteroidetes bacterium]|nr:hypothetical protein [Bacteroidota bacterium]